MLRLHQQPDLGAKLKGYAYQAAAVAAVSDLLYSAIFHEQGLGKTKIALDLSLLWLERGDVDCSVIVTKKGLVQNWCDEINLHSHIEPLVLSQDQRSNFYALNSPALLYVTHYEVMKSEGRRFKLFLNTRKVGVFLDEAHKIKNPESEVTKVLFSLAPQFARRVVMTGTPVANRPYDLWAPIFFLDQGKALGKDFAAFRAALDLENDYFRRKDKVDAFESALGSLFQKIDAFTVRETKRTAGLRLPQKILTNIPVEMEPRQSEIYRTYRRQLAAIVIQEGVPRLDKAEGLLKRMLRLVEVASNPALVDESYSEEPAKLGELRRLLNRVAAAGEKCIVWTNFTKNVDWLAREFRYLGAVRVHGKMAMVDRLESLRRFKHEEGHKVLVATPAAAKEGLTLTSANHAVFFDRSFSLDDYLQAQDRIHRISQSKTCHVSNLIATDSIDEWVDVLLAAKELAAQLAQGDIDRSMYAERVSYVYGEMLHDVLGIPGRHNAS